MDNNCKEFNRCVEEVNKLRIELYKLDEEEDNVLQGKLSQLISSQLDHLKELDSFLVDFSSQIAPIKKSLKGNSNSLPLPKSESATHFKAVIKNSFQILTEEVEAQTIKNSALSLTNKEILDLENSINKEYTSCDINNDQFYQNCRKINNFINDDYQLVDDEVEEFSDSTINTIMSDNVSSSSII